MVNEIIKNLLSSADLQKTIFTEENPSTPSEIIQNLITSDELKKEDFFEQDVDIKIEIPNSNNDCCTMSLTSNQKEVKLWTPPDLIIGEIYVVYNSDTLKFYKAQLMHIKDEFCYLRKERSCKELICTKNQIAVLPTDKLIPVGTRVVALANRVGEILQKKRPHQFGITAEVPTLENKNRYLIIFDDGVWQYAKPDSVWPLHIQNYDSLPKTAKVTVAEYLQGFYDDLKDYQDGDLVQYSIKKNDVYNQHFKEIVHGVVTLVDASVVTFWCISRN